MGNIVYKGQTYSTKLSYSVNDISGWAGATHDIAHSAPFGNTTLTNQTLKFEQVSPDTIMIADANRGSGEQGSQAFGGTGGYAEIRCLCISNHKLRSWCGVFFNGSARIVSPAQMTGEAGFAAGAAIPASDPANRGELGDISVNGWNSSSLTGYWTAMPND